MKIGAKAKGECLKQSSSQRGARVLAFWATARDSHATRLAKVAARQRLFSARRTTAGFLARRSSAEAAVPLPAYGFAD